MTFNVVKRRRIDTTESEFAKYTYLAHPFAKNNGLRLLDDINLNKVLSLQSLSSDIDIVSKEKANDLLDTFEKIAKKYPYENDINAERELIEIATKKSQNQ